MSLRVLLINPWIYDFSAYNLWAIPLGLLKTAEYLSQYNVDLKFIDCLKVNKTRQYNTGKYQYRLIPTPEILKGIKRRFKAYGISEEEFIAKLKDMMPVDIILITTVMSYWYLGAKRAIQIVKSIYSDIPIVLGGIYPTIYPNHAMKHCVPHAVCIGKAEGSLNVIIGSFGFKLKQVNKSFTPYYNLNIYPNKSYAPILTSYGCPFRCTYCASHLINETYTPLSIDDVIKDITELYRQGIRDFAFYDDALLYNGDNHIKPILQHIIKRGIDINLHTPNGLHCRYIDDEMAHLFMKSGFKTIRLGYESFDKKRQSDTGGKTTDNDLITSIKNLKRSGFSKKDIGVYLMYGLPRQDIKEVKDGVEFLMGLDVQIKLTEFSPIKGTEEWKTLVDLGIIDNELDPLLTNNTVFAEIFGNYDSDKINKLKTDVMVYNKLN